MLDVFEFVECERVARIDFERIPENLFGLVQSFEFDQGIKNGLGAGSYPADGILSCTVGLDCSGFVSQAWAAPHHTTSNLDQIASVVTYVRSTYSGESAWSNVEGTVRDVRQQVIAAK